MDRAVGELEQGAGDLAKAGQRSIIWAFLASRGILDQRDHQGLRDPWESGKCPQTSHMARCGWGRTRVSGTSLGKGRGSSQVPSSYVFSQGPPWNHSGSGRQRGFLVRRGLGQGWIREGRVILRGRARRQVPFEGRVSWGDRERLQRRRRSQVRMEGEVLGKHCSVGLGQASDTEPLRDFSSSVQPTVQRA